MYTIHTYYTLYSLVREFCLFVRKSPERGGTSTTAAVGAWWQVICKTQYSPHPNLESGNSTRKDTIYFAGLMSDVRCKTMSDEKPFSTFKTKTRIIISQGRVKKNEANSHKIFWEREFSSVSAIKPAFNLPCSNSKAFAFNWLSRWSSSPMYFGKFVSARNLLSKIVAFQNSWQVLVSITPPVRGLF